MRQILPRAQECARSFSGPLARRCVRSDPRSLKMWIFRNTDDKNDGTDANDEAGSDNSDDDNNDGTDANDEDGSGNIDDANDFLKRFNKIRKKQGVSTRRGREEITAMEHFVPLNFHID